MEPGGNWCLTGRYAELIGFALAIGIVVFVHFTGVDVILLQGIERALTGCITTCSAGP
jgi:hypothetical protein